MASRPVARSPEEVAADRAEIAAVVEGLAEGAQYRRPPDAPTLLPHTGAGGSPGPTDKIGQPECETAADHGHAIYVGDGSSGFLSQKRRPCLETVSKPISTSKRTASACVGSPSAMRNCSIAAASDFEILACKRMSRGSSNILNHPPVEVPQLGRAMGRDRCPRPVSARGRLPPGCPDRGSELAERNDAALRCRAARRGAAGNPCRRINGFNPGDMRGFDRGSSAFLVLQARRESGATHKGVQP